MVFIHSSERGHNRDCTYCPTSAPPDILHQSRDLYFLRKVRRIVYYVKARVLENPRPLRIQKVIPKGRTYQPAT